MAERNKVLIVSLMLSGLTVLGLIRAYFHSRSQMDVIDVLTSGAGAVSLFGWYVWRELGRK